MAMNTDRIAFITQLAEPLAASLGLVLWGVECVGAKRTVLRVFVEKAAGSAAAGEGDASVRESGVSVEECAELSRLLGASLDVEDPFAAAWTLEISSPGFERTFFQLAQLRGYEGKTLDVVLSCEHPSWPVTEGIPGRKHFRGVLRRVDEGAFVLGVAADTRAQGDPEEVVIPWELVRRVRLIYEFSEPGLPGKGGGSARKALKSGGNV